MSQHNDQIIVNNEMSTSMRHQRNLATALYLLTTSLLFADQNLMSPNLSAIAAEFQFDDMERDKKLGGEIFFLCLLVLVLVLMLCLHRNSSLIVASIQHQR